MQLFGTPHVRFSAFEPAGVGCGTTGDSRNRDTRRLLCSGWTGVIKRVAGYQRDLRFVRALEDVDLATADHTCRFHQLIVRPVQGREADGIMLLDPAQLAEESIPMACYGDVAWLARKRSARNVSYGQLDAFDDHHRSSGARC